MPDMKKKYMDEVRGALQAKLGLKNVMQIPKLEKIVISTGIGTSAERDAFTEAKKHLGAMTGQLPVCTSPTRPPPLESMAYTVSRPAWLSSSGGRRTAPSPVRLR